MPRLFTGKVILYLLLLLILDVSIVPVFAADRPRPVFLFLFVLFVAYEWDWRKTFAAALWAGLIRDVISMQALGAETFSLLIASAGLIFYIQKVQTAWTPVKMLGAFGFVFMSQILSVLWASLAMHTSLLSLEIFRQAFFSALLSAALLPVFFVLSRRVFRPREPSVFSYNE